VERSSMASPDGIQQESTSVNQLFPFSSVFK